MSSWRRKEALTNIGSRRSYICHLLVYILYQRLRKTMTCRACSAIRAGLTAVVGSANPLCFSVVLQSNRRRSLTGDRATCDFSFCSISQLDFCEDMGSSCIFDLRRFRLFCFVCPCGLPSPLLCLVLRVVHAVYQELHVHARGSDSPV